MISEITKENIKIKYYVAKNPLKDKCIGHEAELNDEIMELRSNEGDQLISDKKYPKYVAKFEGM